MTGAAPTQGGSPWEDAAITESWDRVVGDYKVRSLPPSFSYFSPLKHGKTNSGATRLVFSRSFTTSGRVEAPLTICGRFLETRHRGKLTQMRTMKRNVTRRPLEILFKRNKTCLHHEMSEASRVQQRGRKKRWEQKLQ